MDKKIDNHQQCHELSALLQTQLDFARAELTCVPGWQELQLYLLNADFPQRELTTEQLQAVLNYPAYWAFCWASGQVLARFLRDQASWLRQKRVLDFGSGSGVAGIAAALVGAGEVVACDLDPDAQRATVINARLNGVTVDVRPDYEDCDGDFDIILVADVLYDRENLHWLDDFLQRAPTVLVADSRVRNFDYAGYRKLGEWQSTTLPDLDEFDEFGNVSIYLGGEEPAAT
jgi:predicted nicotinamide N-methyase